MQNLGVVLRDKAHPAHIGGEVVDKFHACRSAQTLFPTPQVEQEEFVGLARCVGRSFQINATHPVAGTLERSDQVMTNKTASPRYQYPLL